MADILRVTTPLMNKSPIGASKPVADPSLPFNLSDIAKVVKPSSQSEILNQNNGLLEKEAPTILMNMLKDPTVTVSFLRNIFMLQEIIKLLPVNNNPFTQEIQQLFDALLINPEEIVSELMRQEDTTTNFKGELFTFLRNLSQKNVPMDTKLAIANLLKAINGILSKQDVLDSVANSLQHLSEVMSSSNKLSESLIELSKLFKRQDSADNFSFLKSQVLEILKDVESSILYSPKIAKIVPLIIYNLSRFQDNPDFLQETIGNLLMQINGKEDKSQFLFSIKNFMANMGNAKNENQDSRVMNILAEIISRESMDESLTLLGSEKVEKIIHSLLSSPCNFTPLLHFVIPVEFMDIKSFAELWIDPNSEEQKRNQNEGGEHIHMLITFEIEGIGQFEAELFVNDGVIDLALMCPQTYMKDFSGMGERFSKSISNSSYRFGNINIGKLETSRSLMDVFKTLPYKRTGIDVKI